MYNLHVLHVPSSFHVFWFLRIRALPSTCTAETPWRLRAAKIGCSVHHFYRYSDGGEDSEGWFIGRLALFSLLICAVQVRGVSLPDIQFVYGDWPESIGWMYQGGELRNSFAARKLVTDHKLGYQ